MKKIMLGLIICWWWGNNLVQAQLVINEIYATPLTGEKEWLEIYNPGEVAVALDEWRIAENVNGVIKNPELIAKSGEATLEAKGYWVVENSKLTLNNSGDTIYLLDPSGMQIDVVTHPKLTNQQSYCRIPDGDSDWQLSEPTRGFTNNLPEEKEVEVTAGTQTGATNSTSANNKTSNTTGSEVKETTKNQGTKEAAASPLPQDDWKKKINFSLPKYTYGRETGPANGKQSAENLPENREAASEGAVLGTSTNLMATNQRQSSPRQTGMLIAGGAAIIVGLSLIVLLEVAPYLRKFYEEKELVADF